MIRLISHTMNSIHTITSPNNIMAPAPTAENTAIQTATNISIVNKSIVINIII